MRSCCGVPCRFRMSLNTSSRGAAQRSCRELFVKIESRVSSNAVACSRVFRIQDFVRVVSRNALLQCVVCAPKLTLLQPFRSSANPRPLQNDPDACQDQRRSVRGSTFSNLDCKVVSHRFLSFLVYQATHEAMHKCWRMGLVAPPIDRLHETDSSLCKITTSSHPRLL